MEDGTSLLAAQRWQGIGLQDISIRAQIGDLTRDGKGAGAQRCRAALGRASLLFVNGSSKSIGFGDLPRAVVGQATPMLAGGTAQCNVESAMCGGVCQQV